MNSLTITVILEKMGKKKGMLGLIFGKSQNKVLKPGQVQAVGYRPDRM